MIRLTRFAFPLLALVLLAVACSSDPTTPATLTPQADMPNPASVYCEEQGYRVEIVTAPDGSQSGNCVFPAGSVCDEWAFFRGECGPAGAATPLPLDPAAYADWWTYTQPAYNFAIQLPAGWAVEEAASDSSLSGHLLTLQPQAGGGATMRLTFRQLGEDILLWPTGVGEGTFVTQGTVAVMGQPVERHLLVCPTGEITAVWYQPSADTPAIMRGDLELAFILNAASTHCAAGAGLSSEQQRLGDMIVASLSLP